MSERPVLPDNIIAQYGFTTPGDLVHKQNHEVLHKFYNTRGVAEIFAADKTVSFSGVTSGTFVPVSIDTTLYPDACNFDSPAAGVLRYTNTVVPFCLATYYATFSVTSANNVTLKFAGAVNGVVKQDSSSEVRTGVGADVRQGTVIGITPLTEGAQFQLYVANMTSSANVTFRDFTMVVRV